MTDDRFWVGPASAPDTYQLVSCLGGGAEGEVWTAVLPLSAEGRRRVAVKVLPPGDGADDEAAWVNQGHLLRSISHPGLVRVLDAFTGPVRHRPGDPVTGVSRYVVMDLIEGVTLREWLDENPGATASQRLRALTMVAAALDEMHSGAQTAVPVAHGDVKPSNIVMRPDGSTVLVDLGLTRIADGAGRVGRSRPYAAPELFQPGARSTPEADRFAFAATVAHTILGEPPPVTGTAGPDLNTLFARLQAAPISARRPILVRAVLDALAAPPQHRPASLRAWLGSLTDTLSQVTETGGAATTWPLGAPTPSAPSTPPTLIGGVAPVPPAGQPGGFPATPGQAGFPPGYPPPAPRRSRTALVAVLAAVVLMLAGAGVAYALTRPDGRPIGAPGTSGVSATGSAGSSDVPATDPAGSPSPSPSAGGAPDGGEFGDDPSPSPSYSMAPPMGVPISGSSAGGGFIAGSDMVDTGADSLGINGQTAISGYATQHLCCDDSEVFQGSVDVNLSRTYHSFHARVGVEDHSQADKQIEISIWADGRKVYDKKFVLGQSDDVTLDVTGVLRLQFVFKGPFNVVEGVVGDPVVS